MLLCGRLNFLWKWNWIHADYDSCLWRKESFLKIRTGSPMLSRIFLNWYRLAWATSEIWSELSADNHVLLRTFTLNGCTSTTLRAILRSLKRRNVNTRVEWDEEGLCILFVRTWKFNRGGIVFHRILTTLQLMPSKKRSDHSIWEGAMFTELPFVLRLGTIQTSIYLMIRPKLTVKTTARWRRGSVLGS